MLGVSRIVKLVVKPGFPALQYCRNMSLLLDRGLINGEWVEALNKKKFDVFNPASGEKVGSVPDMGVEDTNSAIQAAYDRFQSAEWQNLTAKERSGLLKKWYQLLNENAEKISQIMTSESGKPLIEARGESVYGNSFVEWFAEETRRIYGEIIPPPFPNRQMMLTKQPIGVAALITPWNFPHAMITRKAGAALAAGCTVVIKPAEDTPLTALAIAKLAEEAGFPKGAINVVTCSRKNAAAVGEVLCKSQNVAGVSFTGSTAVGKILYSHCAHGIKRLGLELGGNAPFIVFNSANVDKAVAGAMGTKFRNCGQTCISANRFLVQEGIFPAFVDKLKAVTEKLVIGDGKKDGVNLGPLINEAQFKKVSEIVEDAKNKGATIMMGGKAREDLGKLFYEPTIISDVTPNMRMYNEEIFGPVVSLIKFKAEEEALAVANNTNSGLAGYFYSEDVSQIFRVAKKIETGMVGINETAISCTEAAFGGIKESGLGREGSRHGIDEFVYTKIQDLDGGFFEKFGSLLRQKSIHDEEKMSTPLAPLPEVAEEAVALEARLVGEEGENDSGNETLHDTDSEPEDAEVKSLEFVEDAVGWNLEELYEEILYEILHNIGAEIETSQISLFSYIQDAFKISDSRHEELLEEAKTKEAPEIRLNVEVIEAKDLVPKDPNGLSDPFVTMYLAAVPTHRYNTSVKSETLNPHWEEHFSLPITDDANENILVVEVWDFDPAETVREKMNKIFDVKGVRGLRKLMKEIAVTASSGKHDNELIGKAHIPLKSIPASGLVLWYNLDKKNRLKSRGLIKIRLSFSSEKNNRVAAQEHRHLLRILLLHELETSRVAPYWWSGKFTDKGESVLTQHTAQSGLTLTDVSLVEWSVYAGIHVEHPLAFSLFDRLLDKVIRPIQSETVSSDEVKLFWEATKKLLPSCFAIIRKLRKKTAGDKNCVKTLTDVLNILAKIAMLEPPEGTDLFPAQQYGWMKDNSESPNWDIRGALKDAVVAGANDWFNTINDDTECQKGTDEAKLQHIIKLIQLIRSDLQRAIEYYDKIFQETMRFHYARTLYGFYEGQLAEYVEPIVEEITKNLKRIDIPTHESAKLESHQEINMGTTLFELYLVLKRFAVLGTALDPGETSYKISNYHKWFNAGVTHWLDISVLKALIRIEKAIELDQLVPVDDSVKYSSSAVDALAIFYQIKIFWQQLAWPDVEGSYMFVGKIVDDICRCCVFYADKMSERVEGLGEIQSVYEKKFEVTREWCLAINNIDYIRQSLPPFVKELGVDEIVAKLSDCRSPMEAQRCAETLKNVIDNAVDTEKNKILELVETVARKMSPMMRRFLVEGAELLHQDSNSLDRLMMYLEDSLKTLNMELNDVNFDRILDAIWTELSNVLYDLVQSNLDKRRPPSFFSNLRDALQIMIESFKGSKKCEASDRAVLNNIEQLLELHGFETADLIHQYYLERLRESQVIRETPYGQLTVRCSFKNLVLEIEVMNARNLRAMDSNGSCDPFVRIHFLPEEKFAGIVKPRTNAQSKTLFPLFDEKFVISLSPEQKAMKNAIILFSVKDKDLFGMSNQYIAETFLSFGEIPDADSVTPEQLHLPLTRPYNLDTDCIRALEYRIGDKQAKEFLKKLKQKINNQA